VTHHVINATQSIKNSSMAVMYDEDLIVALTYNPAPPTSNSQASHTETPNDKLLEDGIKLSAASEEATYDTIPIIHCRRMASNCQLQVRKL
jgi:hypothetical protein